MCLTSFLKQRVVSFIHSADNESEEILKYPEILAHNIQTTRDSARCNHSPEHVHAGQLYWSRTP